MMWSCFQAVSSLVCTYLAHHELESNIVVFDNIIVSIIIVIVTVMIIIITVVIIVTGECVGIRLCWHSLCSGCTGNGQCHILAGDVLADVLCSQSADYLPVAMPMHVVIQQSNCCVVSQPCCKTRCRFVMS